MLTLKLEQISKTFPGVKALDAVDLTIQSGEIHAICGENGAGKSTLMNIITGNHQPDRGSLVLNGKVVTIARPQTAFDLGISIVYQHLSLVDGLSVAENIYANRQPVSRLGIIHFAELHARTEQLLAQLGMHGIKPTAIVSTLSQAQRQMVEIAKALSTNPSLLVLDEPTASLTDKETNVLFDIIRKMRSDGKAIVYISHRLEEIFKLADRVSILKDGRLQGTFPISQISRQQLIARMVGREVTDISSTSFAGEEMLLEVEGLTGKRFNNISFQLKKGEILGFAGLIGAGRSEIARAIFGADGFKSGHIKVNGRVVDFQHPSDAIKQRIAYVPEDRKSLGIFPQMTVRDNVVAANLRHTVKKGLYSREKASEMAATSVKNLRIATPGIEQLVVNLSGGNQQKVVLGKWLWTHPKILIVDEPTHGIDVGAKYEIYEFLKSLASEGKGILMISSDLPELIGLCDRVIVLREGTISGELHRGAITEEKIMSMAAN